MEILARDSPAATDDEMGIFHFDYLLANDSAIECVEKLLQVMYGDREDFDTPSMHFIVHMHKSTCPGSGVVPVMTTRHAVEYYDKLFKWMTRLRAVDVEAKLSELVAVANEPFPSAQRERFLGPYFTETMGKATGKDGIVVGNTYVVLAMICMAAGARVPPELAQAFAKAAENEARRVRAMGAPVASIAVMYRRSFAAMVHDHDFSDSKTRMFIREALGPRELNYVAHVEAGNFVIGDRRDYSAQEPYAYVTRNGMHMAWTPSKEQPVPRSGSQGLGRATLSPWVNTPTVHELGMREPPVMAPFVPSDVADDESPPTLEGVSVYQFERAPPSIEELKREHAADVEGGEPAEPLGPDGKSAQQIVDEKADDIRAFAEEAARDASIGGKKTRRGGKKKKKQPEPAASEAAGRLDVAAISVVVAAAAKRIAVLHRAKGDHNFDDEDVVGRGYGEKLLPFITTLVDPAEPMPPQLMVVADLIEQGETDDILTDLTFAERAPETPGSMEKVISVPAWSSDDEGAYEDTDEETVAEDEVVDPSLPPATEAALQSENARLRERLAAAEARAAAAEASLAANAAAPAAPVYNFL